MDVMRILIVTPSLNQGAYIESTIASVLSQLGEHDCYVVVDGESTDDTQAILNRYRDMISHIHVDAALSQAGALAWAFERFDADVCCYLNSDDLLLPGALERVRGLFASRPELTAVYSNRLFIDEKGNATGVWALPRHSSYCMRRWDYIPQETCFWLASAMQNAGGIDAHLEFALDYDFFVRMMSLGRFEHINDHFGAFRVHAQSKTSTVLATTGKAEIDLIQERYAIRRYPWDRFVGGVLRRYIEWRSGRTFERERRLLQSMLTASKGPLGQKTDHRRD